ncbi:hypothetical protein B6S44_28150 [Bosea sp. Tri-44]|uniref:DUF4258 domain-containing protein n=1 Tax=Bosea sp. Tri-44 TaxID=1972137 RepID=UPI00100F0329|nr:DUF4258 domain-containing protein [Bosea sp. Tri-44]RXT43581.1 hypothetical protein B6S44_28150 [Bosea sp. Tri-44]
MIEPERRFSYTNHANSMLVERDIRREWVERTILSPDAIETDPKHLDRTRAYKALPERDGRVLRVVYVQSGQTCRVITLFLDRSRRR